MLCLTFPRMFFCDTCWKNRHYTRFLFEMIRFAPAYHNSTIAPHSHKNTRARAHTHTHTHTPITSNPDFCHTARQHTNHIVLSYVWDCNFIPSFGWLLIKDFEVYVFWDWCSIFRDKVLVLYSRAEKSHFCWTFPPLKMSPVRSFRKFGATFRKNEDCDNSAAKV